jgi:hypothetical protein
MISTQHSITDEVDESKDSEAEQSTWPGYNDDHHHHPPDPVLLLKYGFKYALLSFISVSGLPPDVHTIHLSFHPNFGGPLSLSRGYRLFKVLEHLSTELSIIFAAFDPFTWSQARHPVEFPDKRDRRRTPFSMRV